jgi:small subunit ribosomal protein S5
MNPKNNNNRSNDNRNRRPNAGAPEEKQFEEQTLHIDRVARVVKGGRRFRFRALVVVGDKKGKVGIGSAKGADVSLAVNKATEVAKKSVVSVNLYKDTIPHDVEAKTSGSKILLLPARPGTGLIAGGVVRSILEIAGVKNILSKSLGSSNKTNTAYATLKALEMLVPSKDWHTTRNNAKPVAKKPVKKVEKAKA